MKEEQPFWRIYIVDAIKSVVKINDLGNKGQRQIVEEVKEEFTGLEYKTFTSSSWIEVIRT